MKNSKVIVSNESFRLAQPLVALLQKNSIGFKSIGFEDANGVKCSIQESSVATDSLVWLGSNDIGLKEFVANRSGGAWQDVELADTMHHHYVANNRMHLTRDQVASLIPVLQHFVDTGVLPEGGDHVDKK